jgi:aromatic ring-cleaving dioxygenase
MLETCFHENSKILLTRLETISFSEMALFHGVSYMSSSVFTIVKSIRQHSLDRDKKRLLKFDGESHLKPTMKKGFKMHFKKV